MVLLTKYQWILTKLLVKEPKLTKEEMLKEKFKYLEKLELLEKRRRADKYVGILMNEMKGEYNANEWKGKEILLNFKEICYQHSLMVLNFK